MSFIYRSDRVGKNGKVFSAYKIRTMKHGVRTQFASEEVYTRFGRVLRKFKIDEFLQIVNVLKGEMTIVGPRPDFQEVYDVMPDHAKKTILSIKPGCTSLSSVHFFDEEKMLQEEGEDKYKNYYTRVKPAKILLDTFYIQNRCFLLDVAIVYMTIKKIVKSMFKK